MVKFLWIGIVTALVFRTWVDGFVEEKNLDGTVPSLSETNGSSQAFNDTLLMVELTLVKEAAAKGAVCLDGTASAYHLHRGYGSGANSWLIHLQGVQENLPRFCTSHLDPTSCFFPENLIVNITTPLFILNSAYDSWQTIGEALGDWYFDRSEVKVVDETCCDLALE
ncbi:unnamed protein product [Malus baccata var. baccata]